MKNFKVVITKGQDKHTLIIKAENEFEAKEKLHTDGYSILSIEELSDLKVSGQVFYFEVEKEKQRKKGTINSDDIFKAYLKLRDSLGYKVIYLYDKKDTTNEQKEYIIHELEENYNTYNLNKTKEQKKVEDATAKKQKLEPKDTDNENIDNFYIKKQLEVTQALINQVLKKMQKIITGELLADIEPEKKEIIQKVYNEILILKTSKNIPKLKQYGEIALSKIGELELKYLEEKKDKDSKELLKETNRLLKSIGSSKQYIEKDKDINYQIKEFFNKLQNTFSDFKSSLEKKEEKDKGFSYYKDLSLVQKYEDKLKETNIEILKNFYLFIIPINKEKKYKLLVRREFLEENIYSLKAKLNGKSISYTRFVKGTYKNINKLIEFLKIVNLPIITFICIFSFIFIFYFGASFYFGIPFNINYNGLFYVLLSIISFSLIKFTHGLFSFLVNLVIFFFIFIFGVVNF